MAVCGLLTAAAGEPGPKVESEPEIWAAQWMDPCARNQETLP